MGKVIVVTSGKGGVGKTTSTAALGAALAQRNEKVVVVDFDVGLRNLDWIICDSPAGIERGATLAMRHADVAVVVTNPEVSSVRDPTGSSACSMPRPPRPNAASGWKSTCC